MNSLRFKLSTFLSILEATYSIVDIPQDIFLAYGFVYKFSVHFIRATVFINNKSFFQVGLRQHREKMFLYI